MAKGINIIKNVLTNWIAYLLSIIINFLMMPFVIHQLGDTAYGIWILIGSLTGYLGLLDFGIASAFLKYTAEFRAKKNQQKLNEFVNTTLIIYSIIGILAFCVCILIGRFGIHLFKISPDDQNITQLVIFFVALDIALSFPLGVFGGLVRGFQRYDLNNIVEIGVLIVRTILIICVLKLGFGLVSLAIINLSTKLIGNIWRIFYAKRLSPLLKITFRFFNRNMIKTLLNYSIYSFLLAITVRVVFYTDSIVIGMFMSMSAITYYSIAGRLIHYLGAFVGEMTGVLVPAVSELEANRDIEKIKKLLIHGIRYSLLIALPAALIFIILGKPFITLWMGADYAEKAMPVLKILMIAHLFELSQYTSSNVLYGLNRHKFYAFSSIVAAVLNLILSIILVKGFGLVGVALGTAIPMIILNILILPLYISRVVKLSLRTYFRDGFLIPFLVTIPFVGLIFYLRNNFYPDTWFKLAIELLVFCAMFVTTLWFLCFEKSERSYYLSQFKFL